MKGSVDLRFLAAAERDLSGLGRLARPLLSAGIRDQVALSLDDLPGAAPSGKLDESAVTRMVPGAGYKDWYALPVGSYRAIVHPVIEDGHRAGAVVGRIFAGGEYNILMPGSE